MVTQVQLATKIQIDTVGVPKYVHATLMLRQEERVHNFGTYFDRGFFVADRLFYIPITVNVRYLGVVRMFKYNEPHPSALNNE